ncbi:MAG: DUF2461 domain-containing protein, partial [Sphingobacteriales bacterium]
MAYFTTGFIQFFKELAANNDTAWFNDNRKTYEQEVKKPFTAFIDDMIARIQKEEPEVRIKAADAIMRINKDIRFAKDKKPYNLHTAANISRFGKKDKSYPGFYIQLGADEVRVIGGSYMIEPEPLLKIRKYIAAHTQRFADARTDKSFVSSFGSIAGEQNKRLPAELQQAAEQEPLIANKQFFYAATFPSQMITAPDLPDQLMHH